MHASPETTLLTPDAPAPAALLWGRLLLWLPACAVQGALIAWVSILAQEYSAPALIFPLLVGVGLGATMAGMTRVGQVGHRVTIFLGLALAVVLTVVGQHYIRYRIDLSRTQNDVQTFYKARQLFPDLTQGEVPIPPDGFLEYLRWQAARGRPLHVAHYVARGWIAWLTWTIDGLLIAFAAVAVVLPAIRQPYCNECRNWYRTVRSGRVANDLGRRLGVLLATHLPEPLAWVRYRMADCTSGCGPTRLMLFWEDSEGDSSAVRFWLSPEGRHRVTEALDQAREHEQQCTHPKSSSIPPDSDSPPPTTSETPLP